MDALPSTQANQRLRQARIARNWRQEDLADHLGTTVVSIKRWERGSHQPSAYYRVKLCALFDQSAEELGLVAHVTDEEHLPDSSFIPETQIEYLPSLLTSRPIEYQSLFISYASQDEAIARRLHSDLRANDVPCWFAPHDLTPGDNFREEIDKAIHVQDKLLLILSKDSVMSKWVRYEVNRALNREIEQERKMLYPLRLDDTVFTCTSDWAADLRAHRHIGDFTRWQDDAAYQKAFTRLLRDLKVDRLPMK
jgi:transcriptional regulator with XRE-family HTH domain